MSNWSPEDVSHAGEGTGTGVTDNWFEWIAKTLAVTIVTVNTQSKLLYIYQTKIIPVMTIPMVEELFLIFCNFLCDPNVSGFFQSEEILWSYFRLKSLQKIKQKKLFQKNFTGQWVWRESELYFNTTISMSKIGSALGFSYRKS